MTCLEVRDRLTEHSLGVLSKTDAREVERHLEWCTGCRKEASELFEGAASMALALPVADPPSSLEGRILERFRMAAGRAPVPTRGRMRVLLAATLTAVFLAVGAMGWAIAERGKAASLQAQVIQVQQETNDLAQLINLLRGRGLTLTANLVPPRQGLGFGTAIIFNAPKIDDFVVLDIPILPPSEGPFQLQLVDPNGVIVAGELSKTPGPGSHLVLSPPWFTNQNLGRVTTVRVIDSHTQAVVLTGAVAPYSG